jgi:flagellar motor switch protein FliG
MNDETVNGAKIAADILSRMDPARKERLVRKIQEADPNIAMKIEENLFSFEDIGKLTPKSLQTLLTHVSRDDLLLSLKASSPELVDTLLINMSSRHAQMIQEELSTLPPSKAADARTAQRRILQILEDLRREGKIISSTGDSDIYV